MRVLGSITWIALPANMLWPQAVGWGPKVLGKLGHAAEIAVNGLRRIVADFKVFTHPLA